MKDFTDFAVGFWIGFIILMILASVGVFIYVMYYLVINGHGVWVVIAASVAFCICCGIRNMDGPFDDLL